MKQKAEILHSILEKYLDCVVFLHNTRDSDIAARILSEGFIFENQLSHTTDRVNPAEQIEIAYFLFQRKDYGPFTIVIAIPKKIYNLYTKYSNQFDMSIEELITKSKPWVNDNEEMTFVLPPEHIAGYFDNESLEFLSNKLFNPSYLAYRDRDEF
ncbi:MAG: hypothetical protein IH591_08440 [Bacteroidales bacterium]|nr:hypothetical protein [Bacteroidales bacterium]